MRRFARAVLALTIALFVMLKLRWLVLTSFWGKSAAND